ncbi:MAG: CPBP family intramembrane glutamic endopeptidase, BDIM_20840 family [bacterium]
MMNEIYTVTAQAGVLVLLGAIGAVLFRQNFRLTWFLGAVVLFLLYGALLTRGFWTLPNLFPGADWNWTGKLMSFTGMLIVASLPMFGWQRTGLTLSQGPRPWPAFLLFFLLTGVFFYLAISGGDGRSDWEHIIFQWTMPGFDEELFFRGVLLVALNEAFRGRVSIVGAPIGYGGLLTSVMFGLIHALEYVEGGLSFEAMAFLMTGGPSLLLLWLRERTGSLLLPIVGHNVANGAFTLF